MLKNSIVLLLRHNHVIVKISLVLQLKNQMTNRTKRLIWVSLPCHSEGWSGMHGLMMGNSLTPKMYMIMFWYFRFQITSVLLVKEIFYKKRNVFKWSKVLIEICRIWLNHFCCNENFSDILLRFFMPFAIFAVFDHNIHKCLYFYIVFCDI